VGPRALLDAVVKPPPGIKSLNPDRPARSPALYRLNYYGSVKKTAEKTFGPKRDEITR